MDLPNFTARNIFFFFSPMLYSNISPPQPFHANLNLRVKYTQYDIHIIKNYHHISSCLQVHSIPACILLLSKFRFIVLFISFRLVSSLTYTHLFFYSTLHPTFHFKPPQTLISNYPSSKWAAITVHTVMFSLSMTRIL